jgi:hypothetical protein
VRADAALPGFVVGAIRVLRARQPAVGSARRARAIKAGKEWLIVGYLSSMRWRRR